MRPTKLFSAKLQKARFRRDFPTAGATFLPRNSWMRATGCLQDDSLNPWQFSTRDSPLGESGTTPGCGVEGREARIRKASRELYVAGGSRNSQEGHRSCLLQRYREVQARRQDGHHADPTHQHLQPRGVELQPQPGGWRRYFGSGSRSMCHARRASALDQFRPFRIVFIAGDRAIPDLLYSIINDK